MYDSGDIDSSKRYGLMSRSLALTSSIEASSAATPSLSIRCSLGDHHDSPMASTVVIPGGPARLIHSILNL